MEETFLKRSLPRDVIFLRFPLNIPSIVTYGNISVIQVLLRTPEESPLNAVKYNKGCFSINFRYFYYFNSDVLQQGFKYPWYQPQNVEKNKVET